MSVSIVFLFYKVLKFFTILEWRYFSIVKNFVVITDFNSITELKYLNFLAFWTIFQYSSTILLVNIPFPLCVIFNIFLKNVLAPFP